MSEGKTNIQLISKPVNELAYLKLIKTFFKYENIKLCKCLLSGLNGLVPIRSLLKIEKIISKHG